MSFLSTSDTLEESRGQSGFVRSAEPKVFSPLCNWANLALARFEGRSRAFSLCNLSLRR